MGYQVRQAAPCDTCGKPTQNRIRGSRNPQCIECGIKKMVKVQKQMHSHSGEYYEKWRNRMASFLAVDRGGGGGPSNDSDPAEQENESTS